LIPALLIWAACVPKGTHEVAVVQLEATRLALSARTAQCIEEGGAADLATLALQDEITARQLQLDELVARGASRDQELARLQTERLALLDELARAQGQVEALQAELKKRPKGSKGAAPALPDPPSIVELARDEVTTALVQHHQEEIERERLLAAYSDAKAAFEPLIAQGRAEVLPRGDHTVVRIPTELLFQEGFTTLSPRGSQIIAEAAQALGAIPGRIVTIEAHTDDRPVHTAELASNWERGFAYAMAVLRALEGSDAPARLSAASFADSRPLVPHDSAERARNERIELFIRVDPELPERFSPTPLEEGQ
jgi:flagellar motor protein MotB